MRKKKPRKLNIDDDDDDNDDYDEDNVDRNISHQVDVENQVFQPNPQRPHHEKGHLELHNSHNKPTHHIPTASEFLKQKYNQRILDESSDKAISENIGKDGKNNNSGSRYQKRSSVVRLEDQQIFTTADEAENLGEDFLSSPWLPPSIEKAKEFKAAEVYRGGDWRIDSIDLINASDLGPGVTLYFQFVMTMGIALFFMSILSLPALVFVYSGSRVEYKDKDIFGLYKYTLGNLGYDPTSQTYHKDAHCQNHANGGNSTACIHFNGNEFALLDAAKFIMWAEMLQNLVFIIAVIWLTRKVLNAQLNRSNLNFSASDYSIMIQNLAPDTTEADLISHFSKLYCLDEKDWRGRPKVEEVVPVANIENTGNYLLQNTWVSECIVHKAIGGFIASFKAQQHLTENLYKHRATMKMYAENTSHAKGPNQKKYDKAFQRMVEAGAKIDQLTAQNVKNTKIKVIDNASEGSQLLATGHTNIYHSIDARAVAGFLTFEYTESLARCLKDFNRYSTFPWSLFYPEKLKLKGRKLKVEKAPEPDQVLWEHIEVKNSTKMFVRGRTGLITTVLIIACFIVILQASINKTKFSQKIPNTSLCQSTIPQLYLNRSTTINPSSLTLVRAPQNEAASLDAKCSSLIPNSFYAIYSSTADPNKPIVNYDLNACVTGNTATSGVCPALGAKSFCPCVTTESDVSCGSQSCYIAGGGGSCIHFNAGNIGSCYCYKQLSSILSGYTVAEAFSQLQTQESSATCSSFFNNFSLSSGFTYMSIGIIVVVGALMRAYLKVLSRQECHTSLDHENGSLMFKIFLSNYTTMAVIVLVAYGNIPNMPPVLQSLYIFTGPYTDFDPEWYGNVGFYLMTTFIVSSYSPLAMAFVEYYVLYPFLRCYHYPRIRKLTSNSIVMQNQLNYLEVGSDFEITEHTAQLLTFIFFAMTFSAGLPLMTPLCCLAFIVFFRVDKMFLCRFYKRPPFYGDGSIRIVIGVLPYAAILRMAVACWMFSNSNIFQFTLSKTSTASSATNVNTNVYDIVGRITAPNVLPLFVFMLIVVGGAILNLTWKYLPVYWMYKLFQILLRYYCKSDADIYEKQDDAAKKESIHPWQLVKTGDPLRQQMAPYSGDYFRYLKHKAEIPNTWFQMFSYHGLTQLSEIESEEGWMIAEKRDFVVKVKGWMETHHRSDRTVARPGEWKRTYEVIGDHRCCSYNIERIPAYKIAIKGLREGINALMLNQREDSHMSKTSPARSAKFSPTVVHTHDVFFSGAASDGDKPVHHSDEEMAAAHLAVKKKPTVHEPTHAHGASIASGTAFSSTASMSHHLPLPVQSPTVTSASEEATDSVRQSIDYNRHDMEISAAGVEEAEVPSPNPSPKRHPPPQHHSSQHSSSSSEGHHPRSQPEKKKTPKRLPREMTELDDDFNAGIPGLV